MRQPHIPPSLPLSPALPDFAETIREGTLAGHTDFCPGLSLLADPALGVGGAWRSPAGRLLELEITTSAPGDWLALHLRLEGQERLQGGWIGFACRHAAADRLMIRAALRSGTGDGFSDHFFDKHILATPEPLNHLDAFNLAATRAIPEQAPWRELVLFLPTRALRWDLHDLRAFRL